MAINVYIAEDHPEQARQLEQTVRNYQLFSDWEINVAGVAASGEELLAMVNRENQWNVYLIDINLAGNAEIDNGFVMAQKIREFDAFGFIIFITVRSELSFLTFQYRVQALDFIIKDPAVDLSERIQGCFKTIEQRLSLLEKGETVSLNTGNAIQSFLLDDIFYITSSKGHILYLYTDQREYTVFQETLNHLEVKLENKFIRCHRGFLVNIKAIAHIAKDFKTLTLKDGTDRKSVV